MVSRLVTDFLRPPGMGRGRRKDGPLAHMLRTTRVVGVSLFLVAAPCLAQRIQRIRPQDTEVEVKEPPPKREPVEMPKPRITISDDKKIIVKRLRAVRFVTRAEDVATGAALRKIVGIDTKAVPLLDTREFHDLIKPFMGKGVSWNAIDRIVRQTIMYFRRKDRPVVNVVVPEQEMTDPPGSQEGVLHLLVVEARVGKIKVEGNKWFSDELILRGLRVQEGGVIRASRLIEDVEHINANPFRLVRPVLSPGERLGTTDLTLETVDRFPMRFYIGYEDTGSRLTRLDRWIYGINMGNVFGRGHEAGYQFATNHRWDDIGIHSAYYRIPLANRHKLAFFGSYAPYDAEHAGIRLDGSSWQIGGRYIVPLRRIGRYRHELQAGVDFKRFDNDLKYMGTRLYNSAVDVCQLVGQYRGDWQDRLGRLSFTLMGFYSPGYPSSKQGKNDYNSSRAGADPEYLYGRGHLERIWDLPHGMSLVNRLSGQLSTARLLGSEQLGFGGYATVRGYDEREINADQGIMTSLELRSPELAWDTTIAKRKLKHRIQFLTFWDYGNACNRSSRPGEPKHSILQSVGIGLRYRLGANVSVRLDYGHRLSHPDTDFNDNGRIHLGVLVSY